MENEPDRHPATDLIARLMDWLGLGFGLAFLWLAVSAVPV